jgi:NTP pyrophosphatase (non-canonical NTP hydrolase)
MTMNADGLTKLMEECGELIQVAAKKSAYPNGEHPDGAGDLNERLEQEIADVMAACHFVTQTWNLDASNIDARMEKKYLRFRMWHEIREK